jgi:hypothetical protein
MPEPFGRRRWAIPEGMIPGESTADGPDLESHETASISTAASPSSRS